MIPSFFGGFSLVTSLLMTAALALLMAWMFQDARRGTGPTRKKAGGNHPEQTRNQEAWQEFSTELAPQIGQSRFDNNLAPLPGKYEKDTIVLLVRSPHSIYSYWEVSPQHQRDVAQKHPPADWQNAPWVLRLYDTTDNPAADPALSPYHDVFIAETVDNWNFNQVFPSRKYIVALGRLLPGGFVPLLISAPVITPAASPSALIDPNWPPLVTLQDILSSCPGKTGEISGITSPVAGWGLPASPAGAWSHDE
ncbi:MAG: DUF4912 domain-containing protein [Heliobacteriaceae bacterium]|nr:DUF4912 domain-containing protein [Heliobacteriaceae bacterium]MDD4588218.1 DUF4912 domain-containing protein [Heliobacteriaceae bacterium]